MVTAGDPAPDFTAPLAHGDDGVGSRSRNVTYAWVAEGIKTEPDYDEIIEAIAAVAA